MAGGGPKIAQAMNARIATPTTAGTNQPATRSTSLWIGARERWASATIWTIWASMVSLPTRSARMTKLPDWLMVPPLTRSPSVFSTGIGSPVSIDSSTVLRPSSTTPSTGILSPGRTRSRSPTATSSSADLLVRAVVAHAARGLGREAEQGLDRARGLLAGADLEHLAEQDQRRDHRRRLEVDVDLALGPAEGGREDAGRERRDHAVEVGWRRPRSRSGSTCWG